MVSVILDTCYAEMMLKIFRDIKEGKTPEEKDINGLLSHKGMDYLIEHYSIFSRADRDISKEDIRNIICCLKDESFDEKNELIGKMYKSFREKITKIDEYERFLKELDHSEIKGIVVDKLQRYFPDDISLNSTAYIIFTGHSGGYFNGEDLSLDLGYVYEGRADKLSGTIAHELHHIGYNRICEEILSERKYTGSRQMIFDLIGGLIGEGIAYHCISGVPGPGETGYDDYLEDVRLEKEYFKDINDTIKSIIAERMTSIEDFMKWVSGHMCKRYGGINYIGI